MASLAEALATLPDVRVLKTDDEAEEATSATAAVNEAEALQIVLDGDI